VWAVVGGTVAMMDGAGAVTVDTGDVGTTTARGHRGGWHVGRPGGSVPGMGGARTGGRCGTVKPRGGGMGMGGGARATEEGERARGSPRGPDGERAKG